MAKYIELEATVKAFNNFDAGSPPFTLLTPEEFAEYLYELPTANVAPAEALEHLRDELYAQDLITMEGLKRLNTLIGEYTTVHDGGLTMAEGNKQMTCVPNYEAYYEEYRDKYNCKSSQNIFMNFQLLTWPRPKRWSICGTNCTRRT